MEIERKWMVSGWPEGWTETKRFSMRQGYVSLRPTVRIREEALCSGDTHYVLCFKSGSGLSREELETDIDAALFRDIEQRIIRKTLIPKERRDYPLPGGLTLEVNHVDEGQPTEFWYAEVEFDDEAQARAWDPAQFSLGEYLVDDVTEQPGQSMGAYWKQTRLKD